MIGRHELLLSAQRALLGAIGPSIQAVAVRAATAPTGDELVLIAFVDITANDEEVEEFDADVGGQFVGDFPSVTRYDFQVVRGDGTQVPGDAGLWAFVRKDVQMVSVPGPTRPDDIHER